MAYVNLSLFEQQNAFWLKNTIWKWIFKNWHRLIMSPVLQNINSIHGIYLRDKMKVLTAQIIYLCFFLFLFLFSHNSIFICFLFGSCLWYTTRQYLMRTTKILLLLWNFHLHEHSSYYSHQVSQVSTLIVKYWVRLNDPILSETIVGKASHICMYVLELAKELIVV